MISTLLNLGMTNSVAAAGPSADDYKALVCIFLSGGNDSFNMLVPNSNSEYRDYSETRSNLAIPRSELLKLDGSASSRQFGLHPGMPELSSLFQQGNAAFVANVGTLIEPTTLQDFERQSVRLPQGLFSHSDQIMHWQTGIPDAPSATGWAGRVSDLLHAVNDNDKVSMNVSLAGTNMFQTGRQTFSYEISPELGGSVTPVIHEDEVGLVGRIARTNVKNMMDATYQNLFQQAYADSVNQAVDAGREFADALEPVRIRTEFSHSQLSEALQLVARTIAARESLGMKRQTFFVLMDGYDHHDELLESHSEMMQVLSRALSEFDRAMQELQVHDQVTTFTSSDFARTLTSNGRGSDHAWGGNQIVMGGAVRGGLIYGEYPELAVGSKLDTGRGRLIPTLSTDQYFAELARWFGIDDSDLGEIFPNLDRFHNLGSGAPVGFMKA
ncbi:MAG: DUF1501 domain-containing protein [Verrucomicrobiota bacterium]